MEGLYGVKPGMSNVHKTKTPQIASKLTLSPGTSALVLWWQVEHTHGFPGGSDGKESSSNVGDPGSIHGSGRFPWRRERLPTPIFLPGEAPWTEEPSRLLVV